LEIRRGIRGYGLREDKNRIGIKGLEDCGLKWGK